MQTADVLDAIGGQAGAVDGGFRDLLHVQDAFDHAGEDRVLAVDARLISDRNEELGAGAVGLPGDERRRHRAAHRFGWH